MLGHMASLIHLISRAQSPDFLLYTDASTHGWGCSLLHHIADGLWSQEKSALRINLVELRAVRLALLQFQHLLQSKIVRVLADNTTALAYLSHHGGTHSSALNNEAQWTLRWTESRSISLLPQSGVSSPNSGHQGEHPF